MSAKVTYTVPLKWAKQWGPDDEGGVSYAAGAGGFGSYDVRRNSKAERWVWRYCFDEYYDEGEEQCDSLADGKRRAQENWDGRVQDIILSAKLVA